MPTDQHKRWGYMVMWEFVVKPAMESSFEEIYGVAGDWVRLFTTDENYLGTELIRGQGGSPRYTTLDLWVSKEAYEEFREKHRVAYEAIDRKCEQLTESERKLAEFVRAV